MSKVLSNDDRRILKELLDKARQRSRRVKFSVSREDGPLAPEVHVGLTPPGGIAAISGGTVASEECDVYRLVMIAAPILGDPHRQEAQLEQVDGLTKKVHNLAPEAIAGETWVLLHRDKWGYWVTLGSACEIAEPCIEPKLDGRRATREFEQILVTEEMISPISLIPGFNAFFCECWGHGGGSSSGANGRGGGGGGYARSVVLAEPGDVFTLDTTLTADVSVILNANFVCRASSGIDGNLGGYGGEGLVGDVLGTGGRGGAGIDSGFLDDARWIGGGGGGSGGGSFGTGAGANGKDATLFSGGTTGGNGGAGGAGYGNGGHGTSVSFPGIVSGQDETEGQGPGAGAGGGADLASKTGIVGLAKVNWSMAFLDYP